MNTIYIYECICIIQEQDIVYVYNNLYYISIYECVCIIQEQERAGAPYADQPRVYEVSVYIL